MSAADWIRAVDLALADARLGAANVDRSLSEARSYAGAPRVDGAGRVHATVTRAHVAGGVVVGKGERCTVAVRLRAEGTLEVACSCPARGRYLCEHATAVVVDLAVSPALRNVAASGGDAEDVVGLLVALRKEALEERTLDERLARWLPAALTAELEVDVAPARPLGGANAEDRPLILLRFRQKDTGEVVAPKKLLASRLAPRDQRLVELAVPSVHAKDALAATRAQASLVIEQLSRHPHAKTNRFKSRLLFDRTPVVMRVDAEASRLVARFCAHGGAVACDAEDALLFAGPSPWVWSLVTERFYPVDPSVDLDVASGLSAVPSLPLNERTRERIGRALLGRGLRLGVTLPAPEAFGLPPLETPRFCLRVEGTLLSLVARLNAVYAGELALRVSEASLVDEEARRHGRHLEAEAEALERIKQAGFEVDPDRVTLRAEDERAVHFWREEAARLRAETAPAFEVLVSASLGAVKGFADVDVAARASARAGWLDVQLDFSASMLKVELQALRMAISEGRRYLALEDGILARITDDVCTLVGDASGLVDASGHARLPGHQLGRVDRWLSRFEGTRDASVESLRVALRSLGQKERRVAEPPRALVATLRPYQREALAWLEELRALGAGGILADDMGLGKTVVTLAFALALREAGDARGPVLVVCPTSVVGNWAAEAARFAPSLRTATWRAGRLPEGILETHDLVVTTYGLLRRHAALFAGTTVELLVLDEAQYVKNDEAGTTQAARAIAATMRLALTGTPVENRLGELWSIMNVVNPGLLGSAAEFDARFTEPMAIRPTAAAAGALLRGLVRPFILRRTKAEVLGDLPPKTEIDRACVLGPKQKRLYDALAIALREAVKEDIAKRGHAAARLSVLTAILRLRQMACDPRLVDPSQSAGASAKRESFLELVRELQAEGRRALVFSQFTSLLALWREDLDREGIRYEYLDGQSREREAIVRRFQEGDAPLFLVSLKAGGVGMNLTAADTVIFCDPWWNPAVEAQAGDRAHRPGQTKPVTIVRLVAEGTIEDKVRLLKEHKRELADAVLGAGDESVSDLRLTDEDVALLLGEPSRDEATEAAEEAMPKPPVHVLGGRDLDLARGMARWLEDTGVSRKEIARAIGVPVSQLALLRGGHRVRLTEDVAVRLRALHAHRRGG